MNSCFGAFCHHFRFHNDCGAGWPNWIRRESTEHDCLINSRLWVQVPLRSVSRANFLRSETLTRRRRLRSRPPRQRFAALPLHASSPRLAQNPLFAVCSPTAPLPPPTSALHPPSPPPNPPPTRPEALPLTIVILPLVLTDAACSRPARGRRCRRPAVTAATPRRQQPTPVRLGRPPPPSPGG